MGKQTEYLKGQAEFKSRILKYLKKRSVGIQKMMTEYHYETDEINCCQLEVFLTYNAMISDVKNERLD